MTEREHQHDDESDDGAVQIDLYSIKFKARPQGGYEAPASWRELAYRFNMYLRTVIDCFPGLLADTLVAARNLVRGAGRITGALSTRIEAAHERADAEEYARRSAPIETKLHPAAASSPKAPTLADSSKSDSPTLEELLEQLLAAGVPVQLVKLGSEQTPSIEESRWGIVIVRPDLVDEAKSLLLGVDRSACKVSLRIAEHYYAADLVESFIDGIRVRLHLPPGTFSPTIGSRVAVDLRYGEMAPATIEAMQPKGADIELELKWKYSRGF